MTLEERIAELKELSIQTLGKTLSDSEYWITSGEIYTANLGLGIIDELEKKLEDLKWDYGELENWKCQLEAENKELKEASEWQAIETAPKGKDVLIFYKNRFGNDRKVIARFIADESEECGCDDNCDNCKYNEKKDQYFILEGWYEQIDNWGDYVQVAVNEGKPTHWMPLPEPPINKE